MNEFVCAMITTSKDCFVLCSAVIQILTESKPERELYILRNILLHVVK